MKLRPILGVLLGVVVPLAYWIGMLLDIGPIAAYHEWFRSAHLPEWVMWPAIPWGGIHLAVVLFKKRTLRIFLAPAMFLIFVAGSAFVVFHMAQAIDDAWGGEITIVQIMLLTLSGLSLDALPAVTATLLGMHLSRRAANE